MSALLFLSTDWTRCPSTIRWRLQISREQDMRDLFVLG